MQTNDSHKETHGGRLVPFLDALCCRHLSQKRLKQQTPQTGHPKNPFHSTTSRCNVNLTNTGSSRPQKQHYFKEELKVFHIGDLGVELSSDQSQFPRTLPLVWGIFSVLDLQVNISLWLSCVHCNQKRFYLHVSQKEGWTLNSRSTIPFTISLLTL